MTDKNRDPSSDVERSDPKVADANRDKLKTDADKQMRKVREDQRKDDVPNEAVRIDDKSQDE